MRRSLMVGVVLLAGCVRGGFDPVATRGDGPPRDRAPASRELPTVQREGGSADGNVSPPIQPIVTAANDSCASPFVVSMAGRTSLSLPMDFTGAKHDQAIACCFGAPDLVVKVTDAPDGLVVGCSGGGSFIAVQKDSCPLNETSCFSGSCGVGSSFSLLSSATVFIVVCRPGAPLMTLTLSQGGA